MILVYVLAGGSSYEREISYKSSQFIMSNINHDKYNVKLIDIPSDKKDLAWILEIINNPPDIILNALHGGMGENGSIQGLLDCVNIPYVGSSVMPSSISMNKNICKTLMKANHIPIIDGLYIGLNENYKTYLDKIRKIGYPMIIKPNSGGGSIGISLINSENELSSAINKVIELGDDILIEKFIKGREVACSIFENEKGELEVLTILDIEPTNPFFDYESKYSLSSKIEFSTLPDFIKTMIMEIAKKVFRVLNCNGYARIDMIVDEEQVYFIEIDTLPGLTSASLFPKSVALNNMTFSDFISNIIDNKLKNI